MAVIYIEVIVILALFFVLFVGWVWFVWSRRRARKTYEKNNKKGGSFGEPERGRKVGDEEQEIVEAERGIAEPRSSSNRPDESEGRQLLPSADADDDGEDSDSPRTDSTGLRKLLRTARK